MSDINSVTLTGRLTRDAELRYSQNGGAVVRFSIAVGRSKRNADGTWSDETSFIDCVYFGKSAEGVNSYLSKGRQIAVSGEHRQARWEQDGQSRSRVEVYVNNLTLLSQGGSKAQDGGNEGAGFSRNTGSYSSQGNGEPRNQNSYVRPQGQRQAAAMTPGPEEFGNDDIPF